jgi:hypothetical protein
VNTDWRALSEYTSDYQCVAFAACDSTQRWWPDLLGYYWPKGPTGVSPDDKVDRFVEAFATLGYRPCNSSEFEFGYQKVAIYATDALNVKHMARQHLLGKGWLSKLGDWEDILHLQLSHIEGDADPWTQEYGKVRKILKRSWTRAIVVLIRQQIGRVLGRLS